MSRTPRFRLGISVHTAILQSIRSHQSPVETSLGHSLALMESGWNFLDRDGTWTSSYRRRIHLFKPANIRSSRQASWIFLRSQVIRCIHPSVELDTSPGLLWHSTFDNRRKPKIGILFLREDNWRRPLWLCGFYDSLWDNLVNLIFLKLSGGCSGLLWYTVYGPFVFWHQLNPVLDCFDST